MGGPALHVTYLAQGLAARGYETTLVAGDVARGEESMAFVADRAGVEIMRLPGLSRELSPVRDCGRRLARRAHHPPRPPGRRAHAHREGRRDRAGRRLSRSPVAAPRRRPHVPRPRAPRVLRPRGHAALPLRSSRASPSRPTVSSPSAPRSATSSSRCTSRRARSSRSCASGSSSSLGCGSTGLRRRCGGGSGSRADRFVVGWFGRMTAVKRTDDLSDDARRAARAGRRRAAPARRRRGRSRAARAAGARPRAGALVPPRRLPGGRRAVVRDLRRRRAHLGERGHARDDHRGARRRPARRRDEVGGVPDVVDEGETGFLVRPRDTHALAERLGDPRARPRAARHDGRHRARADAQPLLGRAPRERHGRALPGTARRTTSATRAR